MDEISFFCEEVKLFVRFYIFLRKDILLKVFFLSYSWIEKYYLLIIFFYVLNMEFIVCFLRKYGNFKDFEDKEIL